MSANSDDENRRLGLAAGMDQFISKPFSMKDLQPLLDQVFRECNHH
jgi:DNA-binding response OmpR family regulator